MGTSHLRGHIPPMGTYTTYGDISHLRGHMPPTGTYATYGDIPPMGTYTTYGDIYHLRGHIPLHIPSVYIHVGLCYNVRQIGSTEVHTNIKSNQWHYHSIDADGDFKMGLIEVPHAVRSRVRQHCATAGKNVPTAGESHTHSTQLARGLPLIMYAPRGRWGSRLLYISICPRRWDMSP